MHRSLTRALAAGCEKVAAWADLLDEINVFPVADGDTGRNLKISLAPLSDSNASIDGYRHQLMASATGNSGNIAVAFLDRFLAATADQPLVPAVSAGRSAAWKAVAQPRSGTMLTLFDSLDQALASWPDEPTRAAADRAVESMAATVRSTPALLPELKPAGVVDAGALGMFIFFEAFLYGWLDQDQPSLPVTRRFDGLLRVKDDAVHAGLSGYCVNTVLTSAAGADLQALTAELGDSLVAVPDGDRIRLHMHTHDRQMTRSRLEAHGDIVDWQAAPMAPGRPTRWGPDDPVAVHVMTDAAGSLTRAEARRLGVTLLDSYLIVDDRRVPETLFDPQRLYRALVKGRRVSTAQASVFQRHQSYQSVLERYPRVLYLAVGSAYTGNFSTARKWCESGDAADRFRVLDTGAACGRLGLIVRAVARMAGNNTSFGALTAAAQQAIEDCDELIFLDRLKYLVAGGRISTSKGFFGELLGLKPVISPAAGGAVKVGTLRKDADQVPFALAHIQKRFCPGEHLRMLLQFSDNEQRVREAILPDLRRVFPRATIAVSRISLTSGAHMGPGTWALAFGPVLADDHP